eukprot:SAG31_NODE_1366_length_8621_cov_4.579911_8_plen_236_part_00
MAPLPHRLRQGKRETTKSITLTRAHRGPCMLSFGSLDCPRSSVRSLNRILAGSRASLLLNFCTTYEYSRSGCVCPLPLLPPPKNGLLVMTTADSPQSSRTRFPQTKKAKFASAALDILAQGSRDPPARRQCVSACHRPALAAALFAIATAVTVAALAASGHPQLYDFATKTYATLVSKVRRLPAHQPTRICLSDDFDHEVIAAFDSEFFHQKQFHRGIGGQCSCDPSSQLVGCGH